MLCEVNDGHNAYFYCNKSMPTPKRKKQEDLVGLSRSPITNRFHALIESLVKKPPSNNMHGLVKENRLAWFLKNLFHLGNTHYPYQEYVNPSINNGIFPIHRQDGSPTTIALLSDWASDTEESDNIARLAGIQNYSIHLGDTYYVGNSKEIADNFNDTFGAFWPYGDLGSFAMLGNHEMYSGGKSYFSELLPYMGIYSGRHTVLRQEASFFCMENEHWRIIGLDTGYDSLRGFLGLRPRINLKLHDKQLAWLTDTVQLHKDRRGIVFLSHHQCISGFEKDEFQTIVSQLAPLLGEERTILWFWGHEHRLAFYGHNLLGGKISAYSRCIGNSGMPVEINEVIPKSTDPADPKNRNLVLFDKRMRKTIDGKIELGHNGYVILELNMENLTAAY